MKVKIKKLHPEAIIPKYATPGAACFDLHAIGEIDSITAVLPYRSSTFRTGLAFEVPDGHVMLIFSRSGHGFNDDVRLSNCTGVIDSDYRGEVKVKLFRDADNHKGPMIIEHGSRIAQAMVIPVDQVEFEESDELSATQRGERGFGSTGKGIV